MIHAKAVKGRIFPWNSSVSSAQIDRAQGITQDLTSNREKKYEIGRDGLLGYQKKIPTFTYSLTQFEYASMEFWRRLAGLEEPASSGDQSVDLDDYKTAMSEIIADLVDDNGTFTMP